MLSKPAPPSVTVESRVSLLRASSGKPRSSGTTRAVPTASNSPIAGTRFVGTLNAKKISDRQPPGTADRSFGTACEAGHSALGVRMPRDPRAAIIAGAALKLPARYPAERSPFHLWLQDN